MEESSEMLIRSTIHDLANVLAGVRGILDLVPPGQALSQKDRHRLEAVIDEGVATLNRSRHLAQGTLPDRALEPGTVWRDRFLAALQPLGTLFRCQFELIFEGAPEWDQWPGDLLQAYAQAITRQALPYARADTVRIRCRADATHWLLDWDPAASLPESLRPSPEPRILDICGRWAQQAGASLGAVVSWEAGSLRARVPRSGPA